MGYFWKLFWRCAVSKKRVVEFSTIVRAEPAKVYEAVATAEGLDGWFTTGVTIDPRPGGALVLRWKNWGVEDFSGEMVGEVVEARPSDRFAFRWPVDSGGYMTTVAMDIEVMRASQSMVEG